MTESPILKLFGLPGLTTPQRLVLLAFGVLDDHVYPQGQPLPLIAQMTGLTLGAVTACITALENLNLLDLKEGFDADGNPLSIQYSVNFYRADRLRQEGMR